MSNTPPLVFDLSLNQALREKRLETFISQDDRTDRRFSAAVTAAEK